MKCQNLFSGRIKKHITNLSSAELAKRDVKANYMFKSDDKNVQLLCCCVCEENVIEIIKTKRQSSAQQKQFSHSKKENKTRSSTQIH